MKTKMDRPGVGLNAIIIKDDTVLMGKRKSHHGHGTWSFPGGKLELFETFKECVTREVKEETGLNIKLIDEPHVVITENFFKKEGMHYITLFFRASYLRGEPQILEPDACERWDWFRWSGLPSPLFIPIQNLIKQGYSPFN